MKKLVILGGSVAALRAVEVLRDRDRLPGHVVMLLSEKNTIADRSRYTEAIIRQLKPRQICYRNEESIISGGVDIVSDKTATRVNVTRKKIHFNDRSQMDYDTLIIADTPTHKLDGIAGFKKEGVFGYVDPSHMSQISTLAALNDTIAIQSDHWWGVSLALLLGQKEKDIVLSLSKKHPMLRNTDENYRDRLCAILKNFGITLLIDNEIEEILGDSDVKAIKTRSGKVFASQLVVLDQSIPDLRLLSEGIEIDANHIVVNEQYHTNLPDVFAVDHVAQLSARLYQSYGPLTELLEYQGQVIADLISEYEEMPEKPSPRLEAGRDDFPIIAAGYLMEGRSISSRLWTDWREGRLLKFFTQDDKIVGILAVNTKVSKGEIYACIDAQKTIEDVWADWTYEVNPDESLAEELDVADTDDSQMAAPVASNHESAPAEE